MSRTLVLAALLPVALVAAGCGGAGNDADVVAGKQLFVKNCGSCHVLNRAGTKGTDGPEPRRGVPARREGRLRRIRDPRRGQEADRVSQPRQAAGRHHARQAVDGPGRRQRRRLRRLGRRPARQGHRPARERRTERHRARRPSRRTASSASTPIRAASCCSPPPRPARRAGKITINFANTSGVDHNIAIAGKGKTPITKNGKGSFTADLRGRHLHATSAKSPAIAQAGMKGTLTVK